MYNASSEFTKPFTKPLWIAGSEIKKIRRETAATVLASLIAGGAGKRVGVTVAEMSPKQQTRWLTVSVAHTIEVERPPNALHALAQSLSLARGSNEVAETRPEEIRA